MPAVPDTLIEGTPEKTKTATYLRRHRRLSGAGSFVQLLAEGGMGAVLLVEGVEGGAGKRRLAVAKVLREDRLGDTASEERFRRELWTHEKLSRRLQVPRLVPCLAARAVASPEACFGLLPYYPAGTLRTLIENGGSVIEGLRVLADAVEGLQALHGHGFVHRDFCPDNIFVTVEGGQRRGVLGDLGVALPLGGDTVFSPRQVESDLEAKVGHVGFVAPDGWDPIAADLFSVGATVRWVAEHGSQAGSGNGGDDRGNGADSYGADEALRRGAVELADRLMRADRDQLISTAGEARRAVVAVIDRSQPTRSRSVGLSISEVVWAIPTEVRLLVLFGVAVLGLSALTVVASRNGEGVDEAGKPRVPAAQRLDPSSPAERPVEAVAGASGVVASARALVSSGRLDEAVTVLRESVAGDPFDLESVALLASLLSRQGEASLPEAEAVVSRCLDGNPERGELRLLLARILEGRGRRAEAIRMLEESPGTTTCRTEIRRMLVTLSRFRAH